MTSNQHPISPLEWLGLRQTAMVAGLHITSDYATLVAIRPNPVRLVAIGRRAITDSAVIGNEIRLIGPVVGAIRHLLETTRIPPGTPAVAAVEPLANSITIWETGPQVLTYNVASATQARIEEVAAKAGLRLMAVDIVPAAMARLGRFVGSPVVAGRSPTGWTVVANDGFTDSERSDHGSPAGPPLTHLTGIKIPRRLAGLVDPAGDGPAIGAALGGFGFGPVVNTQPVSEAVGPDWVVQHVDSFDGHRAAADLDDDHGPHDRPENQIRDRDVQQGRGPNAHPNQGQNR